MLVQNQNVLKQLEVLSVVGNKEFGPGHNVFKWGVAKNLRILETAAKDIAKEQEPKPEYEREYWEFVQQRDKAVQDNSFLDENGNRVFPVEQRSIFLQTLAELKAKYAGVIAKHEKTLLAYREILRAKSEINYHKIDCELIPDEMSASEQAILMDMFNDPRTDDAV